MSSLSGSYRIRRFTSGTVQLYEAGPLTSAEVLRTMTNIGASGLTSHGGSGMNFEVQRQGDSVSLELRQCASNPAAGPWPVGCGTYEIHWDGLRQVEDESDAARWEACFAIFRGFGLNPDALCFVDGFSDAFLGGMQIAAGVPGDVCVAQLQEFFERWKGKIQLYGVTLRGKTRSDRFNFERILALSTVTPEEIAQFLAQLFFCVRPGQEGRMPELPACLGTAQLCRRYAEGLLDHDTAVQFTAETIQYSGSLESPWCISVQCRGAEAAPETLLFRETRELKNDSPLAQVLFFLAQRQHHIWEELFPDIAPLHRSFISADRDSCLQDAIAVMRARYWVVIFVETGFPRVCTMSLAEKLPGETELGEFEQKARRFSPPFSPASMSDNVLSPLVEIFARKEQLFSGLIHAMMCQPDARRYVEPLPLRWNVAMDFMPHQEFELMACGAGKRLGCYNHDLAKHFVGDRASWRQLSKQRIGGLASGWGSQRELPKDWDFVCPLFNADVLVPPETDGPFEFFCPEGESVRLRFLAAWGPGDDRSYGLFSFTMAVQDGKLVWTEDTDDGLAHLKPIALDHAVVVVKTKA